MKSEITNDKILKKINIATIIIGFSFLLWRVQFGYCFNDEPFIFTLAQRLSFGDKLFFDEWHLAQPFGLAVLPIYKVYYLLNGSADGLLLSSRYCFCIFWFLTGICVYITFKEFTKYSILCFIYFILFAPLDNMICSYTSFGIIGILLLGCLFIKSYNIVKNSTLIFIGFISSLLTCVVVLSSPYFALVYIFLILLILFLFIRKPQSKMVNVLNILLSNFIFTMLIGLTCILFFSIQNHSISELLSQLVYVFNDPEHSESFFHKIASTSAYFSKPILISYAVGLIFLLLYSFSNKIKKYRLAIAVYCILIFTFSRISISSKVLVEHFFNYEMFDLALLGFAAFALLRKKPWKLFICFSCVDILYTICTFLSSNTKLMSISAALVPSGVVGIIYIIMLAKEIESDLPCEKKSAAIVTVVFILFFQFSLQICVRKSRQYYDSSMPYLVQKIECGAARGLVTTPEECEKYELEYAALQQLLNKAGNTKDKRFVNLTNNPIIYLDTNLKYGTFSAWTIGYGENLFDRFKQYYDTHPDNIPQLVFFSNDTESLTKLFEVSQYTRYDNGEYHLLVK